MKLQSIKFELLFFWVPFTLQDFFNSIACLILNLRSREFRFTWFCLAASSIFINFKGDLASLRISFQMNFEHKFLKICCKKELLDYQSERLGKNHKFICNFIKKNKLQYRKKYIFMSFTQSCTNIIFTWFTSSWLFTFR